MTDQTTIKTQLIRSSDKDKEPRKNRTRLLWLLALLIPACLWLTAQIALIGLGANRVQDTVLSSMAADYSQWEPRQFKPLKPELIGTIRSDQLTLVALPGVNVLGTIVPFIPFGTGTQIAEVPSNTPTATPTLVRMTRTPTPTATPVIIVPPLWTDTPIATATTVETPTWTPVPPTPIPPTAAPPTIVLPAVQFYRIADTINEGMGGVSMAVVLSTGSSQTITVNVATSGGSATAPDDYTDTITTLTFLPGQMMQIVDVLIIDDTSVEGNETLSVTLSSPSNAVLGANNPATLTIVDDDPVPVTPCPGSFGLRDLTVDDEFFFVDGNSIEIACGQSIRVNLGSTPIIANGDSAFDVAIYELQQTGMGNIEMDWVIIQVGSSSTGPWLTVFYWGDNNLDLNTSLGQSGIAAVETDNYPVPMSAPQLLTAPMAPFLTTGIGIDVDSVVPQGTYSWLRIFTPNNVLNSDPAQVDYIEIFP